MEIKRIIKATSKALGVFMIFIALHFVAALILSSVPVNADFKECEKDAVEIHILTNGVHTDLVLSYRNQYMDWSQWVNPSHTKSGDSNVANVAFGRIKSVLLDGLQGRDF